MADKPWEICQYFYDEECPNLDLISKAILFPQLLDPSEIKTVEELCKNCERCLEDLLPYLGGRMLGPKV